LIAKVECTPFVLVVARVHTLGNWHWPFSSDLLNFAPVVPKLHRNKHYFSSQRLRWWSMQPPSFFVNLAAPLHDSQQRLRAALCGAFEPVA